MSDTFRIIGGLFLFVFFLLLIVGGCLGFAWWMTLKTDTVPIQVVVDGGTVYDGPAYNVHVSSLGVSMLVEVNGGFLSLVTQRYYISKDVKVINKRED